MKVFEGDGAEKIAADRCRIGNQFGKLVTRLAARFSGGLPGLKPAKLDNDVARFSVLEKVDWALARKSVIRRLQPRQDIRALHRFFENRP